MPEASFIDNDKHKIGASTFRNTQKAAEHYSWYASSNDSSKASKPTPESTRRYLIMGYFLHERFSKVGSSGKFRLWLCNWNWDIYTKYTHVYTKM